MYNHYPLFDLSVKQLKLYFFQIVKERNSIDLEKIKSKHPAALALLTFALSRYVVVCGGG